MWADIAITLWAEDKGQLRTGTCPLPTCFFGIGPVAVYPAGYLRRPSFLMSAR